MLAEDVGEDYVLGGDQLVSKQLVEDGLLAKGYPAPSNRKWPDRKVRYRFDPSLHSNQRTLLRRAMAHIETFTTIRFSTSIGDAGYVSMERHPKYSKCTSHVGYDPNRATLLMIGGGCDQRAVLHELSHTIGLHHEHERSIAPDYVEAGTAGVQVGGGDRGVGFFDFQSLTIYASPFLYKKGGGSIAENQGLSVGDLRAIHGMYDHPTAKFAMKLVSSNKGWISANDGEYDMTTDRHEPKTQETYRIHTKSDGSLVLQCHNGHYVSRGSSHLRCNRDEVRTWEKFKIRWINAQQFALQCDTGKWVHKQGQNRLRCKANSPSSDDARFEFKSMN